jgi:hypothetical protein
MKGASLPSSRVLLAVHEAVGVLIMSAVHFATVWPAGAALESGEYQTVAGATVVEFGDLATNGTRVVPLSATLTFNLNAAPPSLAAIFPNAVLEGEPPIPLTVRSSFGAQAPDGTYHFRGDYLQNIYPSGTQYGFDWRFSTSTNGEIIWDGVIGWWGGRAWQVTISNLTVVPAVRLSLSRAGAESLQITWATNFAGYVLEQASSLSGSAWGAVTTGVTTAGDRFSVTVTTGEANQFFGLRKP